MILVLLTRDISVEMYGRRENDFERHLTYACTDGNDIFFADDDDPPFDALVYVLYFVNVFLGISLLINDRVSALRPAETERNPS